MEALAMNLEDYRDKRVLVTGHTGFKGAWLCAWLGKLGAKVTGVSLPEPVSDPSLFESVRDALDLEDRRIDIRDALAFDAVFRETDPDYVFHLAAQPLVRKSYATPLETWSANVTGTAHVLESLRNGQERTRTAVLVTTDKCYLNREWLHSYREDDPLGGYDPYSASKAACEILIASYRSSYGLASESLGVASARAGNVIGGGDWAEDRIVPDCVRAVAAGVPVEVRNRHATRPWQHVLDPLAGYLHLGACIRRAQVGGDSLGLASLCSAFNFGPDLRSNRSVADLVELVTGQSGGEWGDATPADAPHEASKLNLAIDKAFHLLHWTPRWDFETAVSRTVSCYGDLTKLGCATDRLERLGQDIDEFSIAGVSERGNRPS